MNDNQILSELKVANNIDWKTILISFLIGLVIGMVGVAYFGHNYYEAKITALNNKLTDYEARYSDSINQKEAAIIAKAKAEEKANTPVKEYIEGKTQTVVQWLEKESPKDADVKQTFTNQMKYEYNGVQYDIPMTAKDGSAIKDGQLSINQTNSAVLNVDDVVNRQIANTINKKDKEIQVLEREKKQQTFWGTVIGFGVGSLLHK
jgi:hypothetical protein